MASNFLLVIEGINGESQSKAKPKSIELDQFNWGASNQVNFRSGGGGGVGTVTLQEIICSKKVDSSSPVLFQHVYTGKPFKASLHCYKQGEANPVEYMTVKLTEAAISNYSQSASGQQGEMYETFSIGYAQIEVEYNEQSDKGGKGSTTKAGYNQKKTEEV